MAIFGGPRAPQNPLGRMTVSGAPTRMTAAQAARIVKANQGASASELACKGVPPRILNAAVKNGDVVVSGGYYWPASAGR